MRKVKIKKLPTAQRGGVAPYTNIVHPPYAHDFYGEAPPSTNDTLSGVPREFANIEAEKGEVLSILDKDGLPATYKVGGKRHSEGGTPLNVEPNNFIFSDTAKMKIKDKEVLKQFGETKAKTPAEIAKKYNINHFRKVLEDPTSDNLQKETAEKMIANYNLQLGKLALAQESIKGFPNGIPQIALPYMAMNGLDPNMILPSFEQESKQMGVQKPYKKGGVVIPMIFQDGAEIQGPYRQDYINALLGATPEPPVIKPDSFIPAPNIPTRGNLVLPPAAGYYTNPPVTPQTPNVPTTTKKQETPKKAVNRNYTPTSIPNIFTTPNQEDTSFEYLPKQVGATATSVATPPTSKQEATKGITTPTSLPKGESRKSNYFYTQEFLKAYTENANVGYKPEVPYTHSDDSKFTRPSLQHQDPNKRVFGDEDWTTGQNWEDFTKRHQWFLKDHPDFDPEDPQDVRAFQTAYNAKAKEYGLPEYFFGDSEGTGVDGKFGEHTWATPGFNPIEKPAVKKEIEKKASEIPFEQLQVPNMQEYPDNWWAQDVINTWGAARDLNSINKYLPWAPQLDPYLPTPVFYDPNRELAANAEQANIATQGVGAFAGPQMLSARTSQIQGSAAKNAADISARYNNQNVGVANQFETTKTGILNQYNLANAQIATDLYDKTTVANQQYDNAKRDARAKLREQYVNAITNRATTAVLNRMYPQYAIDPATGGMMWFKGGRPIKPEKAHADNQKMKEYEMWLNKGLTHEQAVDLMGTKANPQAQSPYDDEFIRRYMGLINGIG